MQYDKGLISRKVEDLPETMDRELERIENTLKNPTIESTEHKVHYAAPDKPTTGVLYYADGTTWDPGSGEGLYRYNLAGSWVFVG